jgi:putative DNA primase/helicase
VSASPPGGDGPAGAAPPSPAQKRLKAAYSRPEPLTLPVVNDKGRAIDCEANIVHILEEDPGWQGVIALDQFADRPMKRRATPVKDGAPGPWLDLDDNELQLWINLRYALRCDMGRIRRAVNTVANRHAYNEVREYLDALRWDGKLRIKRWLERYLGAGEAIGADEEASRSLRYLRRVAVKTLIGMVARVYEPGCKLDTMTILEGPQGALKSTVWRTLGAPWFTDAYLDIHSKEPMAIILGMWVVEWSELEALNRADLAAVKRFLAQSTDRYRTWYGTRADNVPRRCVFVGTVNPEEYLRDSENRRFWPVKCGEIKLDELRRDRDQLLAEAVRWYRRGVRWWVQGSERELFMEQQERRYQFDSLEDRIRAYVDPTGEPPRNKVTVAEVLGDGLKLPVERWTAQEQGRVQKALRRLGFERRQQRKPGSWKTRTWQYERAPDDPLASDHVTERHRNVTATSPQRHQQKP